MNGRIFLLEEGGRLRPMEEEVYASEDLLQRLLADYPDLLAGDQMDDVAPRRWLLVRRELGVPDSDAAADRWAVDHLFLDQDGVPTLVEVKRSSDTRIRREVVGQMLDYAAHATAYWPPEKIRALDKKYLAPQKGQARPLAFVQGDVRPVHEEMRRATGGKNIWLAGGGDLVGQFHDAGLLDEIIVQVGSVILGSGKG